MVQPARVSRREESVVIREDRREKIGHVQIEAEAEHLVGHAPALSRDHKQLFISCFKELRTVQRERRDRSDAMEHAAPVNRCRPEEIGNRIDFDHISSYRAQAPIHPRTDKKSKPARNACARSDPPPSGSWQNAWSATKLGFELWRQRESSDTPLCTGGATQRSSSRSFRCPTIHARCRRAGQPGEPTQIQRLRRPPRKAVRTTVGRHCALGADQWRQAGRMTGLPWWFRWTTKPSRREQCDRVTAKFSFAVLDSDHPRISEDTPTFARSLGRECRWIFAKQTH